MNKYFWAIVVFSIFIVLLSVFLFFVWKTGTQKEVSSNIKFPLANEKRFFGKEESEYISENGELQTKSDWNIGTPESLEFRPLFKEKEDQLADDFLKKFSSIIQKPYISGLRIDQPTESSSKETIKPGKISDEEWFKRAYPENYIAVLRDIENLMRDNGFLSNSEDFEFTSEEKINKFLYRVIDFTLSENIITSEQAKSFRTGIGVVWPNLRKMERADYEKRISAFLFPLIKKALAVQVNVGVECYRTGFSTVPVGANIWSFCCNCGIRCAGYYCYYSPECGEGGVSCVRNFGCLNAVCQWPAPAIWDPVTGLCGCG